MRLRTVGKWFIAVAFIATVGCKANEDYSPDQRTTFERYLDGRGVEYTQQNGVYRVIGNSNRDGYDSATILDYGDSAYLYYAAYLFSSSSPTLYYSNMSSVADSVPGLNTEYWPSDPFKIKLGATPMISGMGNGLPGCREGDSVALFITSDLAYGADRVGMVPPNSPVMMIVNVEKVIK